MNKNQSSSSPIIDKWLYIYTRLKVAEYSDEEINTWMIEGLIDEHYVQLEKALKNIGLTETEISDAKGTLTAINFALKNNGLFESARKNTINEYDIRENKSYGTSSSPIASRESRSYGSSSSPIGGDGGSGCFIATAAYGEEFHSDLIFLYDFRDTVLSKSNLGRRFIRFYYTYSPSIANYITSKPIAKLIVRTIIKAMIKILKLLIR